LWTKQLGIVPIQCGHKDLGSGIIRKKIKKAASYKLQASSLTTDPENSTTG